MPPAPLDPVLHGDYEQLKRFSYEFMLRDPARFAEAVVAGHGMSFLDKLWRDWSPGYSAGEDLAWVKECLRERANLAAAISYYRAPGAAGTASGSPAGGQHAAEQQALRVRLHSPPSTCTEPLTAASGQARPGAPNAFSPPPRAWW